jgi:anti-anti-sigma regulatory factor
VPVVKEDAVADPSTVDDLGPGDHACLTFTDPDERLDIVAAFVRDGLVAGERVVCYTDTPDPRSLTTELAERGLPVAEAQRSGQLIVAGTGGSYLADGPFSADGMIDLLTRRIAEAHRDGYTGLRLSADMGWALRPTAGLEQVVDYETRAGRLLADGRATAVCQYDRHRFDPVTLASVAAAHSRAVAAVTYHDDALLRICRQHVPPGIRLAGEIDFRYVDALARALAEAVRLDEHVHVNLTQLRFIDVAAATAIVHAAAGQANGQRMTVTCVRSVGKIIAAIAADEVSRLRLVVRDDR